MGFHWKVWLLIFMLIFSALAIAPWNVFKKGAVINSIDQNSTEFESGLRIGMVIKQIDSTPITSMQEYNSFILKAGEEPAAERKYAVLTDSGEFIFMADKLPSMEVVSTPKTKLKTGLDLSGGARALVKPADITNFTSSDMADLIAITNERFNIYGLKDIVIKQVTDLQGNVYMLIEIAGATPDDLEELVGQQGKFEGKIGNKTVFIGGADIAHVERSGQYSGIDGCYDSEEGGAYCTFRFQISLTEEAAKKQADITSRLSINSENPGYLSEKLDLFVDDNLMDSLFISKDLKGQLATQVSIQGSGAGNEKQDALASAQQDMKKLQTILLTGSLPYKLEIVKLDTISPTLGKEFTKNLIILAFVVFAVISLALFIKYRRVKITSAVILTMFSEAFITLGVAALIKWNLDAPSIAGIIAGMGTGVNDQIVILDESVSNIQLSLKERIKRAFFIIIGAFFTIVAAMIPLFWAGAGMLRGFAFTAILSVIIGISITRPAFAEIVKKILE